jgi:hypothetical protein
MTKTGPKPQKFHEEYSLLPETGLRAKQLGLPFYYTGRSCVKGHISPRYASSNNCTECIKEKRAIVGRKMRVGAKFKNQSQSELAVKALADGKKTYIGQPCPAGHTERRATTGNCVECESINAQKRKDRAKWKRVFDLYGLTQSDVGRMIVNQGNQCAICLISFDEIGMHIDHCHTTGKVRSLLCSRCNQAIGLFEESAVRLGQAMEYLKAHNNA